MTGAEIRWVQIGDDGDLDMDVLRSLLDDNTKVLSLSVCSNVTGRVWATEVKKIRAYIDAKE
jgi:selenocysteine lyase/cysteine desulfurase